MQEILCTGGKRSGFYLVKRRDGRETSTAPRKVSPGSAAVSALRS